jgi:hypothetical protein
MEHDFRFDINRRIELLFLFILQLNLPFIGRDTIRIASKDLFVVVSVRFVPVADRGSVLADPNHSQKFRHSTNEADAVCTVNLRPESLHLSNPSPLPQSVNLLLQFR